MRQRLKKLTLFVRLRESEEFLHPGALFRCEFGLRRLQRFRKHVQFSIRHRLKKIVLFVRLRES